MVMSLWKVFFGSVSSTYSFFRDVCWNCIKQEVLWFHETTLNRKWFFSVKWRFLETLFNPVVHVHFSNLCGEAMFYGAACMIV